MSNDNKLFQGYYVSWNFLHFFYVSLIANKRSNLMQPRYNALSLHFKADE